MTRESIRRPTGFGVVASAVVSASLFLLVACGSYEASDADEVRTTSPPPDACAAFGPEVDALALVDLDWLAESDTIIDELRRVDGVDSVTLIAPDEAWARIQRAAGRDPSVPTPAFAPAAVELALAADADHPSVSHELVDADWYRGGFIRTAPGGPPVFEPSRWGDADVVVFFEPGSQVGLIETARAEIEGRPELASVRHLDQQAAYDEFRAMFADSPELIATVSPEILPASLRVLLEEYDLDEIETLASAFESTEGVREVIVDPALLDRAWGLTAALDGC